MGLDLAGLKDFDKDLASRTGEGNFLYQGKLSADGTDFRLAVPSADLNGRYYVEVIKWWIAGKPYVSPETFGDPCPIQAEIDRNEGTKDKDLQALIDDDTKLRKASEFLMVGFELDPIGKDFDDFKVVGDKATVLSCGVQLMKAINRLVTGRIASKIKSEDGITDRELGHNLILSKIGSGKNKTEYKAELGDQFEMDAKYYDPTKLPNLTELVEKQLKSDTYLEGVIANYLYGDAMPEDDKREEKEEKPSRRAAKEEKPAGRPSRSKAKEDDDDKPTEGRRGRTAPKEEEKAEEKPNRRRSLLDDIDN